MIDPPEISIIPLQQSLSIWHTAVEKVEGESAIRFALSQEAAVDWDYVIAVGKAASSMLLGVRDHLADGARAIIVTKYQHTHKVLLEDRRIKVIESGHPVPDQNSLIAGQALRQFVASVPAGAEMLMLVSGGASALAESLEPWMNLAQLQSMNQTLLSEGYSIDQINHIRIGISQIKGGKLLRDFTGGGIRVYGISDIPGNDPNLIGSGIGAIKPPLVAPFVIPGDIEQMLQQSAQFDNPDQPDAPGFHYQSSLVGSNQIAREAACQQAKSLGLAVIEDAESLSGDILEIATDLAKCLHSGRAGVYIWGGEPTVNLPQNPGRGGRNQSLAVALALELREMTGVYGVVAGTDGTDGPTDAAGGLFYSGMSLQGAGDALAAADAGNWLDQAGLLLTTGPTGTNVMDLVIVIKTE